MNLDNPLDGGIDMVFQVLQLTGTPQKDFARSVGVTEKHLSQIRHHTADPSGQLFRRMWTAAMELFKQHTQAQPELYRQMAEELVWLADQAREAGAAA